MASSSSSSKNRIAFAHLNILIILLVLPTKLHAIANCFKSIISFGDSLTDTGNLLYLSPPSNTPPSIAFPPYGETFFNRPTGRASDGRLIIDFIAQDFGIPFIPPFYGGKDASSRDFHSGVNFAVVGATAMADDFFAKKGVEIDDANMSLVAQLSWFKEIFLSTFCQKTTDCKRFLETSLVLVGEIGGNDYNFAFFGGKSLDLVQSFVPEVVKEISSAIKELIKLGAMTLMVPGNLPIGCSAAYLTTFMRSSNEKDYDNKTGCINWLNRFSQYHNKLLQLELDRIREQNPNVKIIYADYYNAAMQFYRSPQKYGFVGGALRACCGGGGPYNVNFAAWCGYRGCNTCKNSSSYVSWDGVHLTEAAYRVIANGLLGGQFTIPQLDSVCASPSNKDAAFSDH